MAEDADHHHHHHYYHADGGNKQGNGSFPAAAVASYQAGCFEDKKKGRQANTRQAAGGRLLDKLANNGREKSPEECF